MGLWKRREKTDTQTGVQRMSCVIELKLVVDGKDVWHSNALGENLKGKPT